jgi:hypothetical protein
MYLPACFVAVVITVEIDLRLLRGHNSDNVVGCLLPGRSDLVFLYRAGRISGLPLPRGNVEGF